MIDSLPASDAPLNSYNVAQLHFAFSEPSKTADGLDSLPFDLHPLTGAPSPALLRTPPSDDADIDYSSRRMSSSAASDSSLQSRADKRSFDFSPSASPVPKRARPDDHPAHYDDDRSEFSSNSPRGVQLPSLATAFQDHHELRRSSLPSSLADAANARRLPHILHRPSQTSLASYQFPPSSSADSTASDDARRPRLSTDTQIGVYSSSDYSLPNTALSSSSSFSFPGNSPLSGAPSVSDDNWASGIVRPSSTPSQVPGALSPSLKYDDSLRSSATTTSLYGGVTRISGQHSSPDRARNSLPVKTEGDWPFSSANFTMADTATNSPLASSISAPAISVSGSPTRSPQAQAPAAALVDRPPRKRGKLPKPVTDYLKDWLHRHSDHPYPSEEEKKQLCNATGLSMSQVSNWMINARRRILAPAHRAAAGPQTNLPYATPARPVLDSGRRASMPADSLTLYHPLSLQSLPEYAHMSGARQLVGLSRSMSSSGLNAHGHHPYAAPLDSYGHSRLSYGNTALHPSSHVGGGSMGGMQPSSYLGASAYQSHSGYASNNGYSRAAEAPSSRYTFSDHAHSVSPQPGSGYNTPH